MAMNPAYHADPTMAYGVRYVWRGRVSSIIGQDTKPCLGGLFTVRHPVQSGKTLAKELAKRLLAQRGSVKYAMHGPNRLLRAASLRDGLSVYEFLRSNPYWGGPGQAVNAEGIGHVLTEAVLARLVERGGLCILYAHLGKVDDPCVPSPALRKRGGAGSRGIITTARSW